MKECYNCRRKMSEKVATWLADAFDHVLDDSMFPEEARPLTVVYATYTGRARGAEVSLDDGRVVLCGRDIEKLLVIAEGG